jgi:hypothetical protein
MCLFMSKNACNFSLKVFGLILLALGRCLLGRGGPSMTGEPLARKFAILVISARVKVLPCLDVTGLGLGLGVTGCGRGVGLTGSACVTGTPTGKGVVNITG